MRAMVATVTLSAVLAATLATAVVTTATAQDAEDEAPPQGTSDEALVDRLVDIERTLPELPPAGADVSEDETFGELEGDFLGARTELELVSDEARQLFTAADDADGAVAEAVAAVARSYLRLEEAYDYLARYQDHDLERSLGTTDDDDVATGADVAAGYVETGLGLVDLARVDALAGYGFLRDSEAADDAEKNLFDAAYVDTQDYLTTIRPETHTLVSASSTAVLVAVERFEDEGTDQARARDVSYVCVPRDQYPFESPDPMVALSELLASDEVDLLPTADCPDLPAPGNEVAPLGG